MAEVENIHDFRNEKALCAWESQSCICDAAEEKNIILLPCKTVQ